jgi:hypothetical protein
VEYLTLKTKRKHQHFAQELDKIVAGYREADFEQSLVDLVAQKSLEAMTEEDKALIASSLVQGARGTKRLEGALPHREKLSNVHLRRAPGQTTSETSGGLRRTS